MVRSTGGFGVPVRPASGDLTGRPSVTPGPRWHYGVHDRRDQQKLAVVDLGGGTTETLRYYIAKLMGL